MDLIVSREFRRQAFAFPARVTEALAEVETVQDAKDLLDKGATLQKYAQQLKVATDVERPIAIGVLRIKQKLGELMPEAKRGRGNKIDGPPVDFHKSTIAEYRKLAKHHEELEEYLSDTEDVPSQAGFLKWLSAPHVSHNSGENEWYTPPEFIALARHVMGAIDLDPASSPIANKIVGAARYCTAKDDGLCQEWHGRVWMNPPYAQPLISQFAKKLIDEIQHQRVRQACVLVNNATDTQWCQQLLAACACMCCVSGRVRFVDSEGNPGSPLQGQLLIYFGGRVSRFAKCCKSLGVVLLRG